MSQNSSVSNQDDITMDKLQFYIRKFKNADEKQKTVIHRLFREEVIRQYKEEHKNDELKKTMKISTNFGL